jgi:hypothetical protein
LPDDVARVPATELGSAHPGESNPGEWVERQCAELGVSVSLVARAAKIDRSTVFRWKTGQTRPYWDSLQRVRSVIDSIWAEKGKAG